MAQQYFPHDPWVIRETQVDLARNQFKESIFSIGNGYMALRGEMEEGVTAADGFSGTYLYGVFETEPVQYYWKRGGFVTESCRLVPVPRWLGVKVMIGDEPLDMGKGSVAEYCRELDMRRGVLDRSFVWTSPAGVRVRVHTQRFVSLQRDHVAAMLLQITPLDSKAKVLIRAGVDASVKSVMTGMCSWLPLAAQAVGDTAVLQLSRTATSDFHVATALDARVTLDGAAAKPASLTTLGAQCWVDYEITAKAGQTIELTRIAAVASSRETAKDQVSAVATHELQQAQAGGYAALLTEHTVAWDAFWHDGGISIEGDDAAQQGMNYCMFSLRQIYSGRHEDLNVVCKGYGEVYGGHYFWDSEITCIPYFLHANPQRVKDLLMFRYRTIDKARAKARSLRLTGAMYPMYTIDGREDSRIPEIHLVEIHPSAAVSWAIGRYLQVSGDMEFLSHYGMEMLAEIARFWTSRSACSQRKGGKWVINGVVGPDEYTHVVNNSCYTNAMVAHALALACDAYDRVAGSDPKALADLSARIGLTVDEARKWRDIAQNMYIPYDAQLGIHPQDDTFLDLDVVDMSKIPDSDIPLQKHWPWDMVLRSRLLKQPDVVLLMNALNQNFTREHKLANYRFYEPICLHDSSLSATEHSILASELGMEDEAYKYFLRISRLDLDDYNFNTYEGLHTTSMCGAMGAIVRGFGALRMLRKSPATPPVTSGDAFALDDGEVQLSLAPRCPKAWKAFAFTACFRGRKLEVRSDKAQTTVRLLEGPELTFLLYGRHVEIKPGKEVSVNL